MNLVDFLEKNADKIITAASETLDRSRLPHYSEAGKAVGHERLARLLNLAIESIRTRDIVPVIDYMAEVAEDRFQAGYTIREVQIAINVLEETIWNDIVENAPPTELAEALGLVATVLGAAKDSLARKYVSLASQTKAPSLNLSALFKGPQGG
jgi:hypothetical protein